MKVVELQKPSDPRWKEAAEYLRELADRFESGDITECVVVLNDKVGNHFETWGHFDDRWRILGAIEYAKNTVHKG